MRKPAPLEITGFEGQSVPNGFSRQEGETDTLGVVLPGRGYSCDMPLCYYASELLYEELGTDLLEVRYDYRQVLMDEGFQARLVADVDAALRVALGQRSYRRVILIGKSLGSWGVARVLLDANHPVHAVETIDVVWLTPTLRVPPAVEGYQAWQKPSLHVLGDADVHYLPDAIAAIQAAGPARVEVIPGADHGMTSSKGLSQTLADLAQVMNAVQEFLAP